MVGARGTTRALLRLLGRGAAGLVALAGVGEAGAGIKAHLDEASARRKAPQRDSCSSLAMADSEGSAGGARRPGALPGGARGTAYTGSEGRWCARAEWTIAVLLLVILVSVSSSCNPKTIVIQKMEESWISLLSLLL